MRFPEHDCPICNEQDARIDELSNLFAKLVLMERNRMGELRKQRPTQYEDKRCALCFVTEVHSEWLALEADDGTIISPLQITREIGERVKVDDGIVMTVNLHEGTWRMTEFEWLAVYERMELNWDNDEGLH